MFLASVLALLIGILLGLLGGGGSILTVPVLVYLADISPKSAIITSLIVVGCTSVIATISHARKQHVCWKTGAIFGSAGMLGAFFGGQLTVYVPDALLLILLALVMLAASLSMLLRRSNAAENPDHAMPESICPIELPIVAILLDGMVLGVITGLVGVGGGFLLVPALSHLAKLPVHGAIGTSLFIISLQSAAALLGHANQFMVDLPLTLTITSMAVLGSFIGAYSSSYVPARWLKSGFGYFVILIGIGLLYKEVNAAIIEQIAALLKQYQQFIQGASAVIMAAAVLRFWIWLHSQKNKL